MHKDETEQVGTYRYTYFRTKNFYATNEVKKKGTYHNKVV